MKKIISIGIIIVMLISTIGLLGCDSCEFINDESSTTTAPSYVVSECGNFKLAIVGYETQERDGGGKIISVTTSLTNLSEEDINVMLPWTLSCCCIGNWSRIKQLESLMAAQVDLRSDLGIDYLDIDEGYRHKTIFYSGEIVYRTQNLHVHPSWFTQRNISAYILAEAFFFTGETVFEPRLGLYVYSDLVRLELAKRISLQQPTLQ